MKKLWLLLLVLPFLKACPDQDEYCAFCSGPKKSKCLLCYDSYPIDGQCVPSIIKDPKCVMYSKEGYCHTCMKGYYSYLGKCMSNPIKNCLIYDPQTGKCHICFDNRMPINNSCSAGKKTPCFIGRARFIFPLIL